MFYDFHRLQFFFFNFCRDTIEMNSVGYAIPENYDRALNTDTGSIPNVYINCDTGENTYDTIDWNTQLIMEKNSKQTMYMIVL